MEDKKLVDILQQSLGQEVQPERISETIKLCKDIMWKQIVMEEPRTGFFRYLSDVFRFEGYPEEDTPLYPILCFGSHAGNL